MTTFSANLQDLIQFTEKHWFEKTGLVIALVLTMVVVATLLTTGQAVWWVTILVLIIFALLVSLTWWISRRAPRTPRNKVGFLVGIACDGDEEGKKLREDFLIPLRQLIKSGKTGSAFHFMELPQHLAKTIIEQDDAQSVRLRSRAHFILYGRIRLRTIEGKEHHVIDLEGMVAHKPIPDHVSQSIAREFSELLPRKVRISTENDLLTFQFTSEWAAAVAKYIIGIAAACSGDLAYAEILYTDALGQLKDKDPAFPIFQKLTERLPTRISELYEAKALSAHQAWVADHDPSHIEELGTYLLNVDESRKDTVQSVLNIRAIHAFLKDRDVDSAIMYLKAIKDKNNGLWHYNMAFLNGYTGDLKSAIRHYRQATMHFVPADVIAQVESFMCWVLQQEPDKYQISYCLGFFNWKIKGDKIQARNDFTDFINTSDKEQFSREIELAQQWLGEIE